MERTAWLALLLVAVAAHCVAGRLTPTARAVSAVSGRIINGENAAKGEFPAQLSLQKNRLHACGGSILNEYWAISAAHCVYAIESWYLVELVAGSTNFSAESTRHLVNQITIHPDYSEPDSWVNDIALLKVETPFPLNGVTVAPIQLPVQGEDTPVGSTVTVVGWGDTSFGGDPSINLQKVDIEVWNQDECDALFWEGFELHVYPTQICAAGVEERGSSCNGDSGGPLLHDGVLVGLVSWSYQCATPPYPTVYTRVSSYVDWINQQIV